MNDTSIALSKSGLFSKVSLLLTVSLLISALGTYLGASLTSGFDFIVLLILFFAGAWVVPSMAKKSTTAGVTALTIWTFISGLFIGPAIHMYAHSLGSEVVLAVYLGTGGIMAVCGAIGALSGLNFSRIGGWLLLALLALIAVGIIGIFLPMSHTVNLLYCIAGIVIFALFFMVDFFRLAHEQNTWEAAIDLTMNIYLDYINMLLFILRLLQIFFGGSSSSKD